MTRRRGLAIRSSSQPGGDGKHRHRVVVRASRPPCPLILGAAAATTINGLAISTSTGTLTMPAAGQRHQQPGLYRDGRNQLPSRIIDTVVTLSAARTLTNKTLAAPTIAANDNAFTLATMATRLSCFNSGYRVPSDWHDAHLAVPECPTTTLVGAVTLDARE